MKKLKWIFMGLILSTVFPVFCLVPKINHGTLEKVKNEELPSLLNIPETELFTPPPAGHDFFDRPFIRKMNSFECYKQTIPDVPCVFYRVIYQVTCEGQQDTHFQRIYCHDLLSGERFVCYEDFTHYFIVGQYSDDITEDLGVMLIIRNNRFDGIMVYRLYENNEYRSDDIPGGEGYTKHMAEVYFFGDGSRHIDLSSRKPDITITASWPLLDAKDLFRYTIQNAFDQNPATSYVENTKDDLMCITFCFQFIEDIDQIKIINGYAENKKYYTENNRIKEIIYSTNFFQSLIPEGFRKSVYLDDNFLFSQFIKNQIPYKNEAFSIFTNKIYLGKKWRDTCLSELDLKPRDKRWFFGDQDE